MKLLVEVTDTFCGEVNYAWVNKTGITLPDDASRRTIVRAAKAAIGWAGRRCMVTDLGDTIEIKPNELCQICFVTFGD